MEENEVLHALGELEDEPTESDVRCSSEDPTAYYENTEEHCLESTGRSVSSLMPSRGGLKGVIIPRATRLGGSMGFDPHKPGIVVIDPDFKDSTFSLDLSKVTQAMVKKAYNTDDHDLKSAAIKTFRKLSKVIPATVSVNNQQSEERKAPPGMQNAYVVPKSTIGGRQLSNAFKQQIEEVVPMSMPVPEKPKYPAPNMHIMFEIPGIGQIETAYHYITYDNNFLVLAYDNRFQGGTKFIPQRTDSLVSIDVKEMPLLFQVHSAGINFKLDNLDVCVLLVEQTIDKSTIGENESGEELTTTG